MNVIPNVMFIVLNKKYIKYKKKLELKLSFICSTG